MFGHLFSVSGRDRVQHAAFAPVEGRPRIVPVDGVRRTGHEEHLAGDCHRDNADRQPASPTLLLLLGGALGRDQLVALRAGSEIAADGKTRIDITTGAFVSEGYIVINLDPLNNPLGASFTQLNVADSKINVRRKIYDSAKEFVIYDLWGIRSTANFAGGNDVMITIHYSDNDSDGVVDRTSPLMPGMFEDTLELYVLNETERNWEVVQNQTLDTTNNYATAYVPHFSIYILLGQAPATALSDVALYPNPCNLSASGITFVNLTMESRVRIFNMAGDLVADFTNEEATPTTVWDLTNLNGNKITPGIYIYLVTDWMYKGDKSVGQIAIVR